MRGRLIPAALLAWAVISSGARAGAQQPPRSSSAQTRLAILIAEDCRAPTPRDLAVIRAGLRSQGGDVVRTAVRALGRLERPALIPDIAPLLRSAWPEVRIEAANAIGQAAQGKPAPADVNAIAALLTARLTIEDTPDVRAVIYQTIGRLPYGTNGDPARAEATFIEAMAHDVTAAEQLGIAQGFDALLRKYPNVRTPKAESIAALNRLASTTAPNSARVRRIAFEALGLVKQATAAAIARGMTDSDAQVRQLAVKAILERTHDEMRASNMSEAIEKAMHDESPIVRLEALRVALVTLESSIAEADYDPCPSLLNAFTDRDPHVKLRAIDFVLKCEGSPAAGEITDRLEQIANDLASAGAPRGWHAAAHAIVALSYLAPARARAALGQFVSSTLPPMRLHAAQAAFVLKDTTTLVKLAGDADDNVCAFAIGLLTELTRHQSDAVYMSALSRGGYQVIRAAADALATPAPAPEAAVAPLRAALKRLDAEGRDNSRDARIAIVGALKAAGENVPAVRDVNQRPITSELTADSLKRLASARARFTIKNVGTFELALFGSEAPATVARFVRLAESGYYNGLTFHRVVPNFVIQGGSPGANEYVGDSPFMRDELGLWPHVRGAAGISTRGRDTGDAQIFIDLVDNPRLDHDYTVFGQVLTGMDVVDRILEFDVIEKVEILGVLKPHA